MSRPPAILPSGPRGVDLGEPQRLQRRPGDEDGADPDRDPPGGDSQHRLARKWVAASSGHPANLAPSAAGLKCCGAYSPQKSSGSQGAGHH